MAGIPEHISWGPVLIPVHMALWVLIALVSSVFIYLKSKSVPFSYKNWWDIVVNGLLTFVLVWKLSVILFNPISVVQTPSLLVFGHGGVWGSVLGLLLSILIMYRSAKKENVPLLLCADLIAYWLLITFAIYGALITQYGVPTSLPWGIRPESATYSYHPIHVYQSLLAAAVFLVLSIKKIPVGGGLWTSTALLFMGLGRLLISNFSYQVPLFVGFSGEQWTYVAMLMAGFLLFFILNQDHLPYSIPKNDNSSRD